MCFHAFSISIPCPYVLYELRCTFYKMQLIWKLILFCRSVCLVILRIQENPSACGRLSVREVIVKVCIPCASQNRRIKLKLISVPGCRLLYIEDVWRTSPQMPMISYKFPIPHNVKWIATEYGLTRNGLSAALRLYSLAA